MNELISRRAAIDAIGNVPDYDDGMVREALSHAQRDVALLPSAQPERKNGRWIPGREIGKEILTDGTIVVAYEDYKCSSCGLILFRLLHNSDGTPFYKFCPNCGADMRERKEE